MSDRRTRVGDLRPSQLLFTYGVGALVDLPHLSVIVLGLDDWPSSSDNYRDLIEPRLLLAVQSQLGPQVTQLRTPPLPPDRSGSFVPLDNQELVGVPVVPFPRWMVCPRCQLLAPISSGLFSLRRDGVRADRNRYVHEMCEKGRSPAVVPARFLVACEKGHLDDFPWSQYVHEGSTSCSGRLRLREYGPSGEARELEVSCDECGKRKRLSQAFGEAGRARLPLCRSRRPHLRDFDSTECGERVRAILLGASNLWFGDILSTVALPTGAQGLDHLIEEYWANLQVITSLEVVVAFRRAGMLGALSRYSDIEIWEAVDRKRQRDQAGLSLETTDLKRPEWNMFTRPGEAPNSGDFRLREVAVPIGFERFLERVVLVERLREVRAFIGFTRIEAPSEFGEDAEDMSARRMVVARHAPSWVPAAEVRGEGLFIQFKEAAVRRWLDRRPVNHRDTEFERAHQNWRKLRGIAPPEAGYPGMRYVLLHSFAHSIMRQLSLESGYTMASVRERIYSRDPEPTHSDGEPMAGVLIYTSAPDSEGTLGGLVSLGEPDEFRRLLTGALREAQLCASDPLCAEHEPTQDQGISLHGAACHTCMLAPETACERGNKYLDRSALVATVYKANLAFFTDDDGLV